MKDVVEKCNELVELLSTKQLNCLSPLSKDDGEDCKAYKTMERVKKNLNDLIKVIKEGRVT